MNKTELEKYKEKIMGLDKLLGKNPNFMWHDLNNIDRVNYRIDFNEFGDRVSFLNITFSALEQNPLFNKVTIMFSEVNKFDLKYFGGNCNQIMGFEIIDQKEKGWENASRYLIRDYENGRIEFTCSGIEIVEVL